MGTLAAGQVVVVRFPFSDLSSAKWRPALVLANASRSDWILCQITSNPYGDPHALPLNSADFDSGSLNKDSFVRPGKLFTAHTSLIAEMVGELKPDIFTSMRAATVHIIQPSDP